MSTPEGDFLAELFRCERFIGPFPSGMPVRACLRRQLDHLVARDGKGNALPPAEWLPAKPYCATQCALGRATLAQARALGVPAETCLRCGSAQVGAGSAAPCAGCAARQRDAGKDVPRGQFPAGGPEKSQRIWTGEAPDVPIGGPPGRPRAVAPLLSRQHHSIPPPSASGHQEQPAEPAEEEAMPSGRPSAKRTCCESKGTRHLASCPSQTKTARPAAPAPGRAREGGVRAKVTPLRPAAPGRGLPPPPELQAAPLDELLRQRALAASLVSAVDGELVRRQREIAAALGQAVRPAVGAG